MLHRLVYPLFMPCLDLDHIDDVEKSVWGFGKKWWHWARFKRSDYVGKGDLKQAVLDKVFELTKERLTGRVEAVIHLRYLGLYFSPVNFYYVYSHQGVWRYVLAEVSNTPWNQKHYYAIPADDKQWRHDKAFHVSPFNPINQEYRWKLKPLNNALSVHLECHREHKEFDATLSMVKQPFTSRNLATHLMSTPSMAIKMLLGIYWHAFKLWRKGAPFYPHPDSNRQTNETGHDDADNKLTPSSEQTKLRQEVKEQHYD